MNNLYSTVFRLLVSILLLGATQAHGQCPPPGFPQPGNTCPLAPILCENLDGYCATINNSNTVQSFPGCPGWTLNNDEWFAFFAGTTTITIQVTPLNCSDGQMMGLQGGIYAGCGPPWVPMDLQCACTESPFILTSNNFVVGQIYWIVLDGCQGNVCDYRIDVLAGSTVGVPPNNPGAVNGPTTACQMTPSNFSIAPVNGATIYNWAVTPTDAGTVSGTNTSPILNWSPNADSVAQLCVTTANLCYENDTPSCIEIEISPNPTAAISGNGTICFGSGDSTNLVIDFTGEAPWEFVYTVDGISQAAIQTSENPFALPVAQPGVYALQNVASVANVCAGTVSGTVTVIQTEVTVEAVVTGTQCGLSNGAIDLTIGGGTAPYMIVWSSGQNTEDLSDIPAGIYTATITDSSNCAVMATFVLPLDTLPMLTDTIEFCPGDSVTIDGETYSQSGTVVDTIPATIGCDTIVTYTLILLSQPIFSDTIEFCPGDSITIGGTTYTQPGTVVDTIPATGGCDTIVTYTLILLPQPAISKLIEFCPGDSVAIGGNVYTQPGTVVDTIPAAVGCDTIVTYTLQYITTPNSSVLINCPENINIVAPPGSGPMTVNYDLPTVSSDCDCPGISLTLTEGLPSGGIFPVGATQVCYEARDSCGNTANCCFDVTVEGERPCDTKIVGCMKWELLTITKNTQNQRTYRIRVTNLCSNKMVYTAFQLPNGIVAVEPLNNSVYAAPSGREYDVRNPNFSPFYSIRFKSNDDGIASGQSDIFEYTLPPQASPAYIHVTTRIEPKAFYSSHLTTILCPVGVTPNNRPDLDLWQQFDLANNGKLANLKVFPNPTSGTLFADLSDWEGEQLQVQIFNGQGQRVLQNTVQASDAPQEIQLPEGLAAGLYFLDVLTEKGGKQTARFVLQR